MLSQGNRWLQRVANALQHQDFKALERFSTRSAHAASRSGFADAVRAAASSEPSSVDSSARSFVAHTSDAYDPRHQSPASGTAARDSSSSDSGRHRDRGVAAGPCSLPSSLPEAPPHGRGSAYGPAAGSASFLAAAALTGSDAAAGGGPVSAMVSAIDALHGASGLPWWATIALTAVGVRAAMLPLSLIQLRASASVMPLFQQAQELARRDAAAPDPASTAAAADAPPPPPPTLRHRPRKAKGEPQASAPGSGGAATGTTPAAPLDPESEPETAAAPPLEAPLRPSMRATAENFRMLRSLTGAPHPLWIVAGPLLQLPVFITAVWAIRRMSVSGWPGLSEGGALWFPDLTLPALDIANLATPLGSAGIALPLAVSAAMFANVSLAFGPLDAPASRTGSVGAWVSGKLRLLLEWVTLPLLLTAMQLPHGAVLYWLTSSSLALAQHLALRAGAVRAAVGLPPREKARGPPVPDIASSSELRRRVAAKQASGMAAPGGPPQAASPVAASQLRPLDRSVPADVLAFAAKSTDSHVLFVKAADLAAAGSAGAALHVLRRIEQLQPGHPRAQYALGQVHASLDEWATSAERYRRAAEGERDAGHAARAWFGAGVAVAKQQGDPEEALHMLRLAQAGAPAGSQLALKALMSQASVLQSAGRLGETLQVLEQAAKLDPGIRERFLRPLQAQMGSPTAGGTS